MDTLFQDLRYALRMMRKYGASTAIAVLTLAIGIGANTAIFSVADLLLFRPVTFEGLDRLVMVLETNPRNLSGWNDVSPANFLDWKRQARSFESLSAYNWKAANLTGQGEPERLRGFVVSPGFFEALRVRPLLGRTFTAEEDQPGRDAVVVLSFGLWQRRFGAAPAVLGRDIQLDGRSHTVVGIAPADFDYPPSAEFWKPLTFTPQEATMRSARNLLPLARLRPGVTLAQAASEMEGITRRLARQFPEANAGCGSELVSVREYIARRQSRDFVVLLLGAAGFVLLIACANVANLQLARAGVRRREIAMRSALGAGRVRLLRQLLTESVLLALFGTVLGSVVAAWAVELIRTSMPPELAILIAGWKSLAVNPRVFVFTLIVAVVAGLVAGLWPALRLSRAGRIEDLRAGGRRLGGGPGRRRAADLLILVQGSLAIILLAGSGLLVKGFRTLLVLQPHLEPQKVLTFRLLLSESKYGKPADWVAAHDRFLERLRDLPLAGTPAAASTLPYQLARRRASEFLIEGAPPPPPEEPRMAQTNSVSPSYFEVLRISLRQGRRFSDQDGSLAPPVVIVSESLARRYFPAGDAIGKRIQLAAGPKNPWMTIVGVAADVRDAPLDRQILPVLYRPYRQAPVRELVYALRTGAGAGQLVPQVRSAVAGVDPDQPIFDVMTMQKLIYNRMIVLEFVGALMTALGVLALFLSSVGLYGVMAFTVSERTQEIGVRMALGAGPGQVLAHFLGRGLALIAASLLLGVVAALALARVLTNLVFGVSASDPATFAAASVVMILVALLACLLPARRAARVDPVTALRRE